MGVHCFDFQLQNMCRLRLADPLPKVMQNLAFTFGQIPVMASWAMVHPFWWQGTQLHSHFYHSQHVVEALVTV
jgi:hypothetical protein